MTTQTMDVRNEDWFSPEQALTLLTAYAKHEFDSRPEYEAGPPLRVTITVESAEDLQ